MIGHHTLFVQAGDVLEVRPKLGEMPGVTIFIGLEATLSMTTDRAEELSALLRAQLNRAEALAASARSQTSKTGRSAP